MKIIPQKQVEGGESGAGFGGGLKSPSVIRCQNVNFLAAWGFIDRFSASGVAESSPEQLCHEFSSNSYRSLSPQVNGKGGHTPGNSSLGVIIIGPR